MYKVARELRLNDKIIRAPGQSVADYFGVEGTEAEVTGLALVNKKPIGVFVRVMVRILGSARDIHGAPLVVDREVNPDDVFTLA